MISSTDISIGLLALVGIACILWRNKRKFDRKNASGIEQFPKYSKKLSARLFDALLQGTGYGCLAGGVLIWVMEYAEAWGWMIAFLFFALLLEKSHYRLK